MVHLGNVIRSIKSQPGYTLMRGMARFPAVREVVSGSRGLLQRRALTNYLASCEARLSESVFTEVDRHAFLRDLRNDGVAFGLRLPDDVVADIRAFADQTECYADRDVRRGFLLSQRDEAEKSLGKPILLAQYFNAASNSRAIAKLLNDPFLCWVAGSYLRSVPTFLGTNLWWTFPVEASEEDRNRHAHLFHRDVDDFRFFKYFFYLTDVKPGEGAHVCVAGSQLNPPTFRRGDRWNIRRYSDSEIAAFYPEQKIKEICGDKGTGFAEDTLCIHKGSTPKREARLLLQLQYGLFDYGVMNDVRDAKELASLKIAG